VVAGFLILLFAIAAVLCFRWQKSLPKQANALLKQAEHAHVMGDLAAAEHDCLRAVVCARRIWLHGRSALVTTLYDLAVLYLAQGKFARAEQTAVNALTAARKMGRKSTLTTSLVALLARIYI
jgi:hypothetical protein